MTVDESQRNALWRAADNVEEGGSRALLLISGQLLDEIARHRATLVKPRAGGILHGLGRYGAQPLRPRGHLFDAAARSHGGPLPPRHGGLIVGCVDRVRAQARLCTFELGGRGAALRPYRDARSGPRLAPPDARR